MARLAPHFPRSRGTPRVDDRRVVSEIICVIRNGLMWKDVLRGYGSHETLYNRFVLWSRMGVFERTFAALDVEAGISSQLMIDCPHIELHRGAASMTQKEADHAASAAPRAGLTPSCTPSATSRPGPY
jgi:transposase